MDYRFYMARLYEDDSERYQTPNSYCDLERDFPGLRYKQMTGLNAYGSPKVYSESFAESDEALVFVPKSGQGEQTDITLTLYFFSLDSQTDDATAYAHAEATYHAFMEFIRGYKLLYYDTARWRKVTMYLASSTTPKTDRLHGQPYLEVDFKFKNISGRSEKASPENLRP